MSTKHVLTAAHWIADSETYSIMAESNKVYNDRNQQVRRTLQIIKHQLYRTFLYQDVIWIAFADEKFEFNATIHSLHLPKFDMN